LEPLVQQAAEPVLVAQASWELPVWPVQAPQAAMAVMVSPAAALILQVSQAAAAVAVASLAAVAAVAVQQEL
jgi:hypothetical protein